MAPRFLECVDRDPSWRSRFHRDVVELHFGNCRRVCGTSKWTVPSILSKNHRLQSQERDLNGPWIWNHWQMVGSWSQGWNHVGKGSSSSPEFKDGLEAPSFSWFALVRPFTNERLILALPSWTPAWAFCKDPVFIWNTDFCSSWNFGALFF